MSEAVGGGASVGRAAAGPPPFITYLAVRLVWGVVGLFLLSVVIFAATHLLSEDPAKAMLGAGATPERIDALNTELGLGRPVAVQYKDWIVAVFAGDLGKSSAAIVVGNTGENASVANLLRPRLQNSLVLLVVAGLLCAPVAIGLACWTALRHGRGVDRAITPAVIAISAVPEFVLGVVLVVIFATGFLHWFPAVSNLRPGGMPWEEWQSFALPALTLALMATPYIYRMTRAMMVEVLESDYIVAARLRGVPRPRLLLQHALPNALAPTVQTLALTATYLVGGAVVVETLFNFPGVGTLLVDAVENRDYPTIQAICLGLATLYTVVFIVADILSILLNPKGDWR